MVSRADIDHFEFRLEQEVRPIIDLNKEYFADNEGLYNLHISKLKQNLTDYLNILIEREEYEKCAVVKRIFDSI